MTNKKVKSVLNSSSDLSNYKIESRHSNAVTYLNSSKFLWSPSTVFLFKLVLFLALVYVIINLVI